MQFFKRSQPRQIMQEEVEEIEKTRKKARSAELLSDALVCRRGRKAGRAPLALDAAQDMMAEADDFAHEAEWAEDAQDYRYAAEAEAQIEAEVEVAPQPELTPEDFMPVAQAVVPHKPGPMISERGSRAVGGGGSVIDRAIRAAELSKSADREHAA